MGLQSSQMWEASGGCGFWKLEISPVVFHKVYQQYSYRYVLSVSLDKNCFKLLSLDSGELFGISEKRKIRQN